jgi:dynein heavy chain
VLKNIYANAAAPDEMQTGEPGRRDDDGRGFGEGRPGDDAGVGGGEPAYDDAYEQHDVDPQVPTDPLLPQPPHWRDQVQTTFRKRRQTPAATAAQFDKTVRKLGAIRKMRLPKLQQIRADAGEHAAREFEQMISPIGVERRGFKDAAVTKSSVRERRLKKTNGARVSIHKAKPPTEKLGTRIDDNNDDADEAEAKEDYTVPIDVEALYLEERDRLDTLPLELFDDLEYEVRSAEEWVQLGGVDDDGAPKGTPARSLYYIDREWQWRSCLVLAYDDATQMYAIRFIDPEADKQVTRLRILFDDEDEARFHERVECCRRLREQTLAAKRYLLFVDSQPSDAFSPIQQGALRGIVERVMAHSEPLVMAYQPSVERLLASVRESYKLCMKQSIIEHIRRKQNDSGDDTDEFAQLNIPPLPPPPEVPVLAVVPTPERDTDLPSIIELVEGQHYTRHVKCTEVILALYRAWDVVRHGLLLDVDVKNMELPMALYEYEDHQEAIFMHQYERINNEWRSYVVNLIRDNLNTIFKLFVNDEDEYAASELRPFLKMTSVMLRQQLGSLAEQSVGQFLEFFHFYSRATVEGAAAGKASVPATTRQGSRSRNLKVNHAADTDAAVDVADAAVDAGGDANDGNGDDDGNGEGDNNGGEDDDAKGDEEIPVGFQPGHRPLFVFQMSTDVEKGEVIFIPPLASIKEVLVKLINVPTKLQYVYQIENDVCPLLGSSERALCDKESVPHLFDFCEDAKDELSEIIEYNLRDPMRLAAMYQKFAHILTVDPEAHVQQWFGETLETGGGGVAVEKAAAAAAAADAEAATKATSAAVDGDDAAAVDLETVAAAVADVSDDSDDDMGVGEADVEKESDDEGSASAWREHTVEETRDEIRAYYDAVDAIQSRSPTDVYFRMMKIETALAKESLVAKARVLAVNMCKGLETQVRRRHEVLKAEFEAILERLRKPSEDVFELSELKEFSKNLESVEIPRMKEEIANMRSKLEVFEEFLFIVSKEDLSLSWDVVRYPTLVLETMEDVKLTVAMDSNRFHGSLAQEQEDFQNDLDAFSRLVDTFVEFGTGTTAEMELYASQVESLQERREKAEAQVESFNKRAVLFGDEVQEYQELTDLRARFRPYFELWSTTSVFHSSYSLWMSGSFIELDPTELADNVSTWHKLMYRLEKEFTQMNEAKPAEVASEMKKSIEEFKKHVPVVQWLRAKGLRTRHWKQLSERLCRPLNPDNELTLAHILNLDVSAHLEFIEDISISATKEYALEQTLEQMAKDWTTQLLNMQPHKDTGTFILKESEDLLIMLDDQILKTQSMLASPYSAFFEKPAKAWAKKLKNIQSILEEWLGCQKVWIYLEPIFSSEDIMRQMPTEGRRFGNVNTSWRKMMAAAEKTPNMLDLLELEGNLLKTFVECNKLLDLIGKGLNDYLETKRLAFPRFYFLSNDELLSILSQTKNVLAVQPHLNKCFDAMNELEFDENLVIRGMHSAEGESVRFSEPIDPNQGAKKGNIELWLKDVETQMRLSLAREMKRGFHAYATTPRSEWVLNHPGQIVLAVAQVYWTNAMTEAIDQNGVRGIREHIAVLNEQLDGLVHLVRGNLDKLGRLTLGALTVIDVHARDVATKLADDGVEDITDFDWLAQLRYTFTNEKLKVHMISSEMDYMYEYLGNTSRLVITPLTDRCYRTLMGALQMHLGGAPEGPAGTGKTETVKDLGKALAIQCVVFNCSDGLNYLAMAKFFKGLAASGAWSCFDEFNRIELEVLSVIAQQISSIHRAINEGKHSFFFEGVNIPVIHTCSVFITMNPGYAGRAELPDNLKALFRTVAMMIPDYAMIGEIVLYSYGYTDARQNARKLVACLRLSSEQLSSQDHYDFGMRNVKSILTAAGALKRKHMEEREDILVLRAINDCNLPKFTSADIPLFEGITKDLFPLVTLDTDRSGDLATAIHDTIVKLGLQDVPNFSTKVMELYDTMCVRHGLMLVGQPFSGKSSAIKVLSKALSLLAAQEVPGYAKVRVFYIAPKAVTQGQLYGRDDENTHEWSDGILPVTVRACVRDTSPKLKWIVFDGPVDALWIEDMNTVLDDNKKLCLTSGEQIKISNVMNLMFEVADLAVASPATVSRCGMVYMEPHQLGWQPLVRSWMQTLPASLDAYKPQLYQCFEWVVPQTIDFVQKNLKAVVPFLSMQQVTNLCRLFTSMIDEIAASKAAAATAAAAKGGSNTVDKKLAEEEEDLNTAMTLESLFLFSAIWSLGCVTDTDGRRKFSKFFMDLTNGKSSFADLPVEFVGRKARVAFPAPIDGTDEADHKLVYEYMFDTRRRGWQQWMAGQPLFEIQENAQFNDIIVPTVDTVRNSWLLDKLITHKYHVLLTGETGTGKSLCIRQKLLTDLPKDKWTSQFVSFSARTTANQTQDIIDLKLERRRAGIYGPPLGKRTVVFIDDLNMPTLEKYGAQPPIELLRQWMDYGGWYDRKLNSFRQVVDMQFVAAMGPPGGGRNAISNRYLRHYSTLCLVPYDDGSLRHIFSTILGHWLEALPPKLRGLQSTLCNATVELYSTIRTELLPTPAKSHYTYNLRDVSKVFQGIMMTEIKGLKEVNDLIRLWSHETTRVFCDRLVSTEDIKWFEDLTAKQTQKHFEVDMESVLDGKVSSEVLYCDFLDASILAENRGYGEVKEFPQLKAVMDQYLADYNTMNKQTMNLVLFDAAIVHVARISRIIRQPYGNALLVGVGGSGRQSLTRLAAGIADYTMFQIAITKNYAQNEWRDDLQLMMKKAGVENKQICFLLTDTQIKHESFVEDMNNILNNGEVPNLFSQEDIPAILEAVMPAARAAGGGATPTELFNFFVDRCKLNIHVVLAFSPVGDTFRNRLRMYPSLVNCTTIDWFHAWPTEALNSVAQRFLKDVDIPDKLKTDVVDVCVDMQERVQNLSTQYLSSLGRHNYVTPTSYLTLIKLFQNMFEMKREEIGSNQSRYENGLEKLLATNVQVREMQEQLEVLRPQLVKSAKETEELLKTIDIKSADVAKTRKVVSAEEALCMEQANEARLQSEDCQAVLDQAMPALNQALGALRVLKKAAIDELKSMQSPPRGVVLVMEALCIMMRIPPRKVGSIGDRTDDYWEPAKKKLLRNTHLIADLENYDKENIPASVIKKIRDNYSKNPDFQPSKVAKSSKAAEGFAKWVLAMDVFDRINKIVQPKKKSLAEANAQLAEATERLNVKKAELQEVQDMLDDLNRQFQLVNKKKESLAAEVEECSTRLERAEKLLGGLSNEKDRWADKAAELKADYVNVVGNVLVSSGVVAYLGVFTRDYRDSCINEWVKLLGERGISCAEDFCLSRVLGDPVEIRSWGLQQLPKDPYSIDNAVILKYSQRWSLFIDPQEQAVRWIKNMEGGSKAVKKKVEYDAQGDVIDAKEQFKVVKQSDDDFARVMTASVMFGQTVLIEALGEELDPVLEPLLSKATFKNAGRLMIRMNNDTIAYDPEFRMYLATKLQNPHYAPETATKVTLINFMITPVGLEDQLLGIVVSQEEPDLERERSELIVQSAENQAQLQKIEDQILLHLNESKGNILDDEALVEELQQSKQAVSLIEKRVAAAAKAEERIQSTRQEYQAVASAASNLFFCINQLSGIDPMYQYSLSWFINLYIRAIQEAEQSSDVRVRTQRIKREFTYSLYRNVCRSLFETHKLLFSFLLQVQVLQGRDELDEDEVRFLLSGPSDYENVPPNPAEGDASSETWLTQSVWVGLVNLSRLPAFAGLDENVSDQLDEWHAYWQSKNPSTMALPSIGGTSWSDKLNAFQRLLVLRCLRPDRLLPAIQSFIGDNLGKQFTEPPLFDLQSAFEDSSASTPLVFLLSPGMDPNKDIYALADEMGYGTPDKLSSISLGQGQGPVAENAIREAIDKGTWVLIQNCHLASSWMPTLEKIVEEIDPATTAPDFRLWITSAPSSTFPVSVLQNGVKMTNEPPKGIKSSLAQSYRSIDSRWINSCSKPEELKKMMFGLCFFHAIVLERRRFGSIGWNILYEFTESDLSISQRQLKMMLDQYDEVPVKALTYLFGQLNYGGRVTDDWDRRTITHILEAYVTNKILDDEYRFDSVGDYFAPAIGSDLEDTRQYIADLPDEEDPDVFGMHANATTTAAIRDSSAMFRTMLSIQPKTAGSAAATRSETINEVSNDILGKLPRNFDVELAMSKYPVVYENSMNTVLVQELIRFNRLLDVIRDSLVGLQKALKGLVVMSTALEETADQLFNAQVPDTWHAVSYPSLKPLSPWVVNLLERLVFFDRWLKYGPPGVFNISNFFFTQSFLTGTLQNHARSYKIPIDEVSFDFEVVEHIKPDETDGPEDGVYIHGLYLEGAAWDSDAKCLGEAAMGQLTFAMPVIHLKPCRTAEIPTGRQLYETPVYKTSARAGSLSTTGHSTNYVLAINLPSQQPPRHWIKRGTALLTQLDV